MRLILELHQMLLNLLLEFHAWSTSRPDHESAVAGDTLFEETQALLSREKEQGMSPSFFGTRLSASGT